MVHKDWQNRKIGERGTYEKSAHMIKNGYIKEFTWIVNPYSWKIYQKIGGKIWKDLSFEANGKKIQSLVV
jgi:hypothetical protein